MLITEQLLKRFSVGMHSPAVKQTAVKTVADAYSTVIIKVFYDLFRHHTKKRCWIESVLEHNTIDGGKGSREVAVQPNLATLVFVLLDNHAEELWWVAKALHDHPQSLSAHCVKCFGQVQKHYIQSFVLLPAFLLELSEDKHHVSGAPVGFEPTMSFW